MSAGARRGEGRAPRPSPPARARGAGPGRGRAGAACASLEGAGSVRFSAGDFAVPMGTGNGACNFGRSKGNGRNLFSVSFLPPSACAAGFVEFRREDPPRCFRLRREVGGFGLVRDA